MIQPILIPQESAPDSRNGSNRALIVILLLIYFLPAAVYASLNAFFANRPTWTGHLITAGFALVFLGMGLWGLRAERISLGAIGVTLRKAGQAAGMILLVWALFALLMLTRLDFNLARLGQTLTSAPADLLTHWLFVGLGEEVLMRGYVLNALRNRLAGMGKARATGLAVLISSLVFASVHIPASIFQISQGQMPAAALAASLVTKFLLGAVMAYIFLRSNNILLAALVHGGCNAPLLGVSGDLLPLLLAILLVTLLGFLRRKGPVPAAA